MEKLRSEKVLLLQQFDYAEDAGSETFRKDIAVLEANLQKLDEQEQKYSTELDAKQAQMRLSSDSVEEYAARQLARQRQKAISQPTNSRKPKKER